MALLLCDHDARLTHSLRFSCRNSHAQGIAEDLMYQVALVIIVASNRITAVKMSARFAAPILKYAHFVERVPRLVRNQIHFPVYFGRDLLRKSHRRGRPSWHHRRRRRRRLVF